MKVTKIKKCRICNSKLKKILDLNDQPPANSLHNNSYKQKKISLKLVICETCFTAQLDTTIDPKYLFKNYFWVTGTSKKVIEYSREFFNNAKKIIKKNKFSVLEIASNDGTFLKPFVKEGCRVLGVDPAINLNKTVKNIKIVDDFFNYKTSEKIKREYKNFDFIFARNVLPHNDDAISILKGFSNLMSTESVGAIEFHYAGNILDELHYDSIYHEHIYYFTLKTLENILKKNNLNIFDCKKSPISGGSLVVYFSKTRKKNSQFLIKIKNNEKNKKYNTIKKWKIFAKESIKHSQNFKKIINKIFKSNNCKLIAYGASARSSTLLNFSKIDETFISHIIDKNKLKDKFFTPGSNIQIKSFDKEKRNFQKYKNILILAWNFKEEIIKDLLKNKFRGKLLIPLPKILVKKCK